jgi:GH3 auxin-responsive promoter.
MSTETVETVPARIGKRYVYLPLASGVFYEFIECGNPDLVSNLKLPGELRIGHRYTMVVSDAYGLRRYQTEDVFECVDFVKGLPDLRFVHRRNLSYSFTGEKLTAEQLRLAYEQAAEQFETFGSNSFLTCFPSFPEGASIPRYRLVIVGLSFEQSLHTSEIAAFVEARLMEINSEYEAKVRSGRLGHMSAEVVGVGEFITNVVNGGGAWLSQFKFLPLYPRLWESLNVSCCQLGR